MGSRNLAVVARLLCGLSLFLLSAAQQKAFALPAAPHATQAAERPDQGKKRKCPLTLQQTLPDAYSTRVSQSALAQAESRGDGRFPPLDPNELRPAAIALTNWTLGGVVRAAVLRSRASLVSRVIPCLTAFRICLQRIGPPEFVAAAH